MWSFFIALFGGAFWTYKLVKEHLESKNFDLKVAANRYRTNLWKAEVLDDKLNAETMSMLETDDGFQKLQDEAIDIIRQLPGLEMANIFSRRSYHARCAVRYIYMVRRGKLPDGDEVEIPISVWCCVDLEFSKSSMVAFARWVEKTMRENGHPDAKLRYSSRLSGAVNQYEKSAVFVWEQTMFSLDNSTRISDANIEEIIVGETPERTANRNASKIQKRN